MTEKKDKKEKKGKKEKKSGGFIGIKGVFGGGGKKSKKKKKVTIDDSSELSTDTGSNAAAPATANKQPVVDKYDQQKEDPYGYEMEVQAEIDRNAAATNKTTKPSAPMATASASPAKQQSSSYSATKQQQVPKKRASSLQVILLLMEPTTRRFEFLQLEFDSTNATVKNILSQIPMSVTEHEIRRVSFTRGVCDKNAKEWKPSTRLSEFCSNMDVLIGLPYDLSAGNTYRLARPILCDEKVLTMLSRAGVDTAPWKMEAKPEPRSTRYEDDEPEIDFSPRQRQTTSSARLSILPLFMILGLVYLILKAGHEHCTSPIMVGVPVKPGTWRSKCGYISMFPGYCTNSFIEVNADGTVNLFDSNSELAMKLKGSSCHGSKGCVDGLLMKKDGSIVVGGKVVKSIISYNKDMSITPWPFSTKPKANIRYYGKKTKKKVTKTKA